VRPAVCCAMRGVVSVWASTAAAQAPAIQWTVSVGPTQVLHDDRAPVRGVGCPALPSTSCSPTGRIGVGPALYGRYHVAAGVSRALPGSALVIRGEALYSRSESAVGAKRFLRYGLQPPAHWVQPAPVDEMFAAGIGLDWAAFPHARVSPYLLTTSGLALNRLRWNSDTTSTWLDEQFDEPGLFWAVGIGARVRVRTRELFVERRALRTLHGRRIAPVSIGLRF